MKVWHIVVVSSVLMLIVLIALLAASFAIPPFDAPQGYCCYVYDEPELCMEGRECYYINGTCLYSSESPPAPPYTQCDGQGTDTPIDRICGYHWQDYRRCDWWGTCASQMEDHRHLYSEVECIDGTLGADYCRDIHPFGPEPKLVWIPEKDFNQSVTTSIGDTCDGRPFITDEGLITPDFQCTGSDVVDVSGELDRLQIVRNGTKREKSIRWLQGAMAEYSSVASFNVFSLQLLSVNAPRTLVARAQRASLDEIAHTQLSLAVANHYDPESHFDVGGYTDDIEITIKSDLKEICVATAVEGGVGETVSTLIAAVEAQLEEDDLAHHTLNSIVTDEARHAALAWDTVRWCISQDPALYLLIEVEVLRALSSKMSAIRWRKGDTEYVRDTFETLLNIANPFLHPHSPQKQRAYFPRQSEIAGTSDEKNILGRSAERILELVRMGTDGTD